MSSPAEAHLPRATMGGVWNAAPGDGRNKSGLQLHLVLSVNRAERLARLLRVLAAIIAEPGLNPLELAEKAGVSDRTLRRDLAHLRDLGYEVAYTSGYEVQEKLNLEGRGRQRTRGRGDDALLQAVAQAVETAGLWRDPDRVDATLPRRAKPRPSGKAPIVLIPSGDEDADFIYATGFGVENALYIRFSEKDDVLVASPLEIDRARAQSRAATVVEDRETYVHRTWARLAARMLRERGISDARVSPNLRAVHLEDLRAGGIDAQVDRELYVAGRRHKSAAEAAAIQDAQRAAESAVVEVVRGLSEGEISDDVKRMHAAVLQALDAGIESIAAGVPGQEPHHAVCQVLVDRGYATTTKGFEGAEGAAKLNHSTGHGVGLEVHEEPALRDAVVDELRDGDVVTVEPGLYLLGLGGVRVEDTGMVTQRGFQNFTTLTRSLNPQDYL